jgi:fatty acid desaturase
MKANKFHPQPDTSLWPVLIALFAMYLILGLIVMISPLLLAVYILLAFKAHVERVEKWEVKEGRDIL